MKIPKVKMITTLIAVFVSSFVGCMRVFADEPSGVSMINVSPMSHRMILTPGEKTTGTIKVSNPNNAKGKLNYSVSVGSFSQNKADGSVDDYGGVDTESKTSYNQIVDWIELGKTSGSILPNNIEVIPFTISVPEDAPAGGQYATIIVRDDTDYSGNNGNVSIQSKVQIASIIYAEVAGKTREEGSIVENNIPSFLTSSLLKTAAMVKNDGNIHADAKFVLQVWPSIGDEEICTNEENPSKSLVLPGTSKYHEETCNLPAVGVFRVKQIVEIFGETSEVERMVVVCPIWLLFIIIFTIAAIIIYFIAHAKLRKNSRRRIETE